MHRCPYCPFRGTAEEVLNHLEYLILFDECQVFDVIEAEDHLLENKKEN